jgi:GAF domain-containing protein
VGYVAEKGAARIAADVGVDSVHFNNPYLPNTRSEMALPLRIGSEIIGVLDVQSTQPEAFSLADVSILSVLSDEVSIAIQNTRLIEETSAALAETELAVNQLTNQTWRAFKKQAPTLVYHFDGSKPEPLEKDLPNIMKSDESDVFTVPVKLRGVTVGNLRLKPRKEGHKWTDDEKLIAEAVAERVALAVENARLLIESQKRAAKEQVIAEITSKIGESINLNSVLQTAVEELGQFLPGSEVFIKFENGTND